MLVVFSTYIMLRPPAAMLDIAPFDWDIMRSSKENCLLAVTLGLSIYVLVASSAWLAYRPAVVTPIWLVSFSYMFFVCAFFTIKLRKKYKNAIDNDTNTNDDVGPTESNNVS